MVLSQGMKLMTQGEQDQCNIGSVTLVPSFYGIDWISIVQFYIGPVSYLEPTEEPGPPRLCFSASSCSCDSRYLLVTEVWCARLTRTSDSLIDPLSVWKRDNKNPFHKELGRKIMKDVLYSLVYLHSPESFNVGIVMISLSDYLLNTLAEFFLYIKTCCILPESVVSTNCNAYSNSGFKFYSGIKL